MQALKNFLTVSPSVVYPDEVLELLGPVERENARLREIVRDMHRAFFRLDIDHCQACPRDTINGPCTKYLVGGSDECDFEEEMRELGIEAKNDAGRGHRARQRGSEDV